MRVPGVLCGKFVPAATIGSVRSGVGAVPATSRYMRTVATTMASGMKVCAFSTSVLDGIDDDDLSTKELVRRLETVEEQKGELSKLCRYKQILL